MCFQNDSWNDGATAADASLVWVGGSGDLKGQVISIDVPRLPLLDFRSTLSVSYLTSDFFLTLTYIDLSGKEVSLHLTNDVPTTSLPELVSPVRRRKSPRLCLGPLGQQTSARELRVDYRAQRGQKD
eukprot:RCo027163